jgi:hypothetical protein
MIQGAIVFAIGLAATLFSYLEAVTSPYGGYYWISIGAITGGIAQFVRGAAAARGGEADTREQAQELLNLAARLESVDRGKAVEVYAEVVRKFPGTRASGEAQRNMQTLTAQKE